MSGPHTDAWLDGTSAAEAEHYLDSIRPVGPSWRRYPAAGSEHCVEVLRREDGTFGIRNSRQPGLVLNFTGDEWHAFLDGLAGGESRRS